MDKALESARRELSSIRTGKASPALLDTVRVDVYGQSMLLNQVASVTAPEARLLVVTPWDKGHEAMSRKPFASPISGSIPPSREG